jgi:hypothetical protein
MVAPNHSRTIMVDGSTDPNPPATIQARRSWEIRWKLNPDPAAGCRWQWWPGRSSPDVRYADMEEDDMQDPRLPGPHVIGTTLPCGTSGNPCPGGPAAANEAIRQSPAMLPATCSVAPVEPPVRPVPWTGQVRPLTLCCYGRFGFCRAREITISSIASRSRSQGRSTVTAASIRWAGQ